MNIILPNAITFKIQVDTISQEKKIKTWRLHCVMCIVLHCTAVVRTAPATTDLFSHPCANLKPIDAFMRKTAPGILIIL